MWHEAIQAGRSTPGREKGGLAMEQEEHEWHDGEVYAEEYEIFPVSQTPWWMQKAVPVLASACFHLVLLYIAAFIVFSGFSRVTSSIAVCAGFARASTRFMITPWFSPTIPVCGSTTKSRTVAERQ